MGQPQTNDNALDGQRAADAFEQRMLGLLNAGALSLMVSVGHRTGLFDVMAGRSPTTSGEIARAARLQERYVREWLGALTVGGIIEYDDDADTYALPENHAALLSHGRSASNLAAYAQYIPMLGSVEDDIISCFRNGGGVPYERFQRFHEIMAEDSGQTVLPALIDQILPLVPGLTDRLERGIRVLDVGCGCGRAINLLAATYPKGRFVGYDLLPNAIDLARKNALEQGNRNIEFLARDLSDFDQTADAGAFDLVVTFDAIHDQAQPLAVLRGIRRTLANGGVYLAQDIKGSGHLKGDLDHPLAPFLYTISCMHCMTVSLAQGGEGLGAMWGKEKALEYFKSAGFSAVEVHELAHDVQNYYYICRP